MTTLSAPNRWPPPTPSEAVLLLAGFDAASERELRDLLEVPWPVVSAAGEEAALAILDERQVAVLCLGAGVPGARALGLLERAFERRSPEELVTLVLAGGPDPYLFAEQIDQDRIYYLTQEPIPPGDLAAVLASAAGRWREIQRRAQEAGGEEPEPETAGHAVRLERLLEAARRSAVQQEPVSVGELAAEALAEALEADRAYYLLYDPAEEVLHAGEPGSLDERRESAAVGLVSFVARTGRPLLLADVGDDPRFEREADDPESAGGERFLAVPATGRQGEVRAVLVAVREAAGPPFTDTDLHHARLLGDQVGGVLERMALTRRLEAPAAGVPGTATEIFRREAAEAYLTGQGDRGELLRLSPVWMRWAYWLLLAVVAGGLLFALFGTLREYASGPAVVRLGGHRDVTAASAGTVSSIEVAAGDQVAPGQPLMRFYRAQEMAELARLERELELQLLQRLRSPADPGPAQALVVLRAQRELARARLEERSVSAPAAGVVTDLRVRAGQHVAPGEILLSLAGERAEPTVVALLPGHYRPLLAAGMSLRLELAGFRHAYQHLTVEEIGDEVIGPAEARRYLGSDIADAVALDGPVVVATARLPAPSFEVTGRDYAYHDGMFGRAEVPVRSEPIVVALFPRLRELLGDGDD